MLACSARAVLHEIMRTFVFSFGLAGAAGWAGPGEQALRARIEPPTRTFARKARRVMGERRALVASTWSFLSWPVIR